MLGSNPNRIGAGFLDRSNELAQIAWGRGGWYRLKADDGRLLPLREQYQLRLADRAARATHAGLWHGERAGPISRWH